MGAGKHHHKTHTMADHEGHGSVHHVKTVEPQKLIEDVKVRTSVHDGKPVSIVTRLHTVVHRHKLPSNINRFTYSDAVNWMRQGRPWRGFFIAAVGIASFAALTGMVAFALLLISSSLNAAFVSFLVAISTIGFIMAFFFSSITVMYVGALGFGGLTIGSIAFFSVWAVIILSGWAAIAWIIWQGLRKAFQFGRHLASLAGSFLFSFPAAQKLQHFGVKSKEYALLKSTKTATS